MVQDRFRFWESRTCSGDPKFAFESFVRSADVVANTIAEAHLWAVDKPMSRQLIEEIIEGANAKFRELEAHGYIAGAKCWLEPELNLSTSLAAGKLFIDYELTPIPPLEQLTFHSHITDRYLVNLLPEARPK